MRSQRADVVREAPGKHRCHSAWKVHRVAPVGGLLVQRGAGLDVVGHVGYVDPDFVAVFGALDRDRVVEVFGVGPVYGHGREMPEVLSLPDLPSRDRLGLLLDLPRELAGGPDGGEKRLVDVARVLRGPDYAGNLAPQRAVLLAGVNQDQVSGLSAAAQLACDQHGTPLLDEKRVCYRVLPPTDQHGRKYQESAPIRDVWQGTL